MTLVPDWILLARDIVAENDAMVRGLLPDAVLESDGHDLHVETSLHGGDVGARAVEIVRNLRGGKPHDASLPADWHIRALREMRDVPVLAHLAPPGHVPRTVGTSIAFSRSYGPPDGYDEGAIARGSGG